MTCALWFVFGILMTCALCFVFEYVNDLRALGPVARSLVSANRWLRGIKMYRFPWYLTLVSSNHASSIPGLFCICYIGDL